MSDKKFPINIEADVTESANELLNAVNKPIKKTADIVTAVLNLVFGWIPHLSNKLDYYFTVDMQRFMAVTDEKCKNVPKENIIEPDIQTISQAASKASYCLDKEELIEMFANLIASTIDSEKADYTHPSFADVILNMSPFDAITFTTKFKKVEKYSINHRDPNDFTPADWLWEFNGDDVMIDGMKPKYQQSINILHRLGLIEFTYASDSNSYNRTPKIKPSGINLTSFGKNFLKTTT